MLQFINQQFSRLVEFILPAHCLLCGLQSFPITNNKNYAINNKLICTACLQATIKDRSSCQHCALPLAKSQAFCGDCLKHPHHFSQIHAIGDYQAPFPALIKKFKYSKNLLEGGLLAILLAESIRCNFSSAKIKKIDYLLPVPLHPDKLRQRGFNQAGLIAEHLSNVFNIPILNNTAIRNKKTQPQEGLSLKQRKANLDDAFMINDAHLAKIAGKHIVIIDDVVTTGATANSLCKVLLENGIKKTDIWCICRTSLKI